MKKKFVVAVMFIAAVISLPFIAVNKNVYTAAPRDVNTNSDVEKTSNNSSSSQIGDSNSEFDSEYQLGDFLILDISTNEVLKISERDYVYGAVAAEMPATFNEEALKAQAVASYSYALRQRYDQSLNPSEELNGAHFFADPTNFLGFVTEEIAQKKFLQNHDEYWNAIKDAVDSIFPTILVYEELPIYAAYHSISMGKTEASEYVWGEELEYLTAVDSSWDEAAPGYYSSITLSEQETREKIENHFGPLAIPDNPAEWFSITSTSPSGTITQMNVCGISTDGHSVRNIFELRSADFTVKYEQDKFTFSVRGYGHGVGLSQYGANFMAIDGADFKEILMHYYPNSELVVQTVDQELSSSDTQSSMSSQ